MNGSIRLFVNRDEDYSGWLTIEFRSGPYSGVGSAYFDFEVLSKEAKKFEAYPLPLEPVLITGGFLSNGDISKVMEEHIHISAYPVGSLGKLGLFVKVAEPASDGRKNVIKRSASAEFFTEYEQLSVLARWLTGLTNSPQDELVMEFSE